MGPQGWQPGGQQWWRDWRERLRLAYEGVDKLYTAEIVHLINAIIASAIAIYAFFIEGFNMSSLEGAGDIENVINSYVATSIALFTVGALVLILGIIGLVLMWQGFSRLSQYDWQRYNIGFLGVKLEVLGILVAIFGFLLALIGLMAPSSSGVEVLIGMGVLLALAVIVILIVAAIALAIGIWRVGSEWNTDFIKLGIILLLIGFLVLGLDIVGHILLLLGLGDAKKKIEAALLGQP